MAPVKTGIVWIWSWDRKKWKKLFHILWYVGTDVHFPWVKFTPRGQEAHQNPTKVLFWEIKWILSERKARTWILSLLIISLAEQNTSQQVLVVCFSLGFMFTIQVVCLVGDRSHFAARSKSVALRTSVPLHSHAHPRPKCQCVSSGVWGEILFLLFLILIFL